MPDTPETPGVPGEAAALRAENARLREANERLRVLLEDKDAKIAELEVKVARLERLMSRNSGNSSMPPSSDDLPGKKPPERKPRRGGGKRKPGKQPGAPGAYLAWNDSPDKTVPHLEGVSSRLRLVRPLWWNRFARLGWIRRSAACSCCRSWTSGSW